MSAYTIKNLKEIEDMAPRFQLSPDLEARFGRVPLDCEQTGASYERRAPNFRTPFGHSHKEQEEVYVVIGGSARLKIEDEVLELGQYDAVRIPGPMMRALEGGPEGAEVIAFGAPNNDNKDAEMVPGWWAD